MSEKQHGRMSYREVYDIVEDRFFAIAWVGANQTGFHMPDGSKFRDDLSLQKARSIVLSRAESYLASEDYPKPPEDRSDAIWSDENTEFLTHGNAHETTPAL